MALYIEYISVSHYFLLNYINYSKKLYIFTKTKLIFHSYMKI